MDGFPPAIQDLTSIRFQEVDSARARQTIGDARLGLGFRRSERYTFPQDGEVHCVVTKALGVAALVMLPLSVAYWHRSHAHPVSYRYDLTLYKSMWVYLKDGVCGVEVLSMPTRTASRTEFRNPLRRIPAPTQASLWMSSREHGPYRTTWVVFPFWLPTAMLVVVGLLPIVQGPLRRFWRKARGRCEECGYDLTGNRSGRCPECGTHTR